MRVTEENEWGHSKPPPKEEKMIAIIRLHTYKVQVKVKTRQAGGDGFVRIEAEDGTVYETHLANVLFIDERGKR